MITENYNSTLAISQSSIKDFKNMPPIEWKKIWLDKKEKKKVTSSLKRGSLVDDLLFSPACVEDKYFIMEIKRPSESIAFIIENIFDADKQILGLMDKIVEVAKYTPMPENKIGYGQTYKQDTLVKKVIDEGTEYYNFLKTTNGKCVVTAQDYMASLVMVEAVKKSEFCKPYLDEKYNDFQFEIVTYDDFPEKLKGCLDIRHHKRKINRVVDFKTADSAYYFEINVRKFGYLEQVAMYDHLLRYWMNANDIYETIEPPINIVIDKTYNVPYIYEYDWKDIDAAWNGYFKYGKWQKGLKDWIKEIQWHLINDLWEYPMEHYLYNKINLNLISHKND